MVLTGLMMAGTFYSQFRILPAMEVDGRWREVTVETAPAGNAGRVDFERCMCCRSGWRGSSFFADWVWCLCCLVSRSGGDGRIEDR